MHTRNMTRTNELKNVYLHSYNSRNATNISAAQIQFVKCMFDEVSIDSHPCSVAQLLF